MSYRNKAILYILLLVLSLAFLAIDHRGIQTGDYLFRLVGLSPWSNASSNTGLHYSVIIGFILLLISGRLVISHFRKKYDKVGRKVVICCIAFFLFVPILTRWSLVAVNLNHSGIIALDYSMKDYKCSYKYNSRANNDEKVMVQCTIKIYNYGNEGEVVEVRPILNYYFANNEYDKERMELEYARIHVPARSDMTYSMSFSGETNLASISGFAREGGVQFRQDGAERIINWSFH